MMLPLLFRFARPASRSSRGTSVSHLPTRPCIAGLFALLILGAGLALSAGPVRAQATSTEASAGPSPRIAFLLDDRSASLQQTAASVRREMQALVSPDSVTTSATWTLNEASLPSIRESIRSGSVEVDVLIAVGLDASQALIGASSLPAPSVATHVVDPSAAESRPASLSIVSSAGLAVPNARLLERLRAGSSGVVIAPTPLVEKNSGAASRLASLLAKDDSTAGSWTPVPAGKSADTPLDALPSGADAAYLLTPLSYSARETDRLLSGLRARQIATVVHRGRSLVERGALATRYGNNSALLPRRVALNAVEIHRGTPVDSLPTALSVPEEPVLNRETADRLGIDLSTDLLLDATTIGTPTPDSARKTISYAEAIRTGVRANRRLQARRAGVDAQSEAVREARSAFFPQVQAQGRALTVDEAQAAASFGAQPERALNGRLAFSQTLYSPQDAAAVDVAQQQLKAETAQTGASRQDVALQAGRAYVNVLRAQDVARVQQKSLDLARENLQLAKARRASGQVGRRAVLRFRTQVSLSRQSVVDARARVEAAKEQLKQVLALPQDVPVEVAPLSARDSTLTLTEDLFARFARSRSSRQQLMRALAEAGVSASREIQSLDAQIAAARRSTDAAQRSYWAPEVALEGALSSRLAEDGAGTQSLSIPNSPVNVPRPPETTWNVGLTMTLPLFTGLRRDAQVDRSQAEVQSLRYQRREARSQLQSSIRQQTELTAAAYTGLREAEAAADAGAETVALVQESYAAGVADVLDLIDAQDALLQTRLAAANARRDLLLRLLQTERAVSRIGPLLSPAERNAFRSRLRRALTTPDDGRPSTPER